jgi:hypothetical protein
MHIEVQEPKIASVLYEIQILRQKRLNCLFKLEISP